ncbi:MAG: hypothetical protein ACPL07_03000, partial [Candidatus Bathyarchaeia archaeon]
MTVYKWFEKAFGEYCMVDPESDRFKLKKSAFDSASKENQLAFKMLVDHKYNGAEIIDTKSDGEVWAKHWMDVSTKLYGYEIENLINNFNQIDVTKLTEADLNRAAEELSELPDLKRRAVTFAGVSVNSLTRTGEAYFNFASKVIIKLMNDDVLTAPHILLFYAAKNKFAFDHATKYIESNNLLSDGKFPLNLIITDLYKDKNNPVLEKELCRWYVNLVKAGKSQISAENIVILMTYYHDPEFFILPENASDAEYVFDSLKKIKDTQGYLAWLVEHYDDIRNKIIKYNEQLDIIDAKNGIVNGEYIKYSIKFLTDKYITDAIVNNFKKLWLSIKPDELEPIGVYSFSKKLTDAYRETISSVLVKPEYKAFTFNALSVSTADAVNSYFVKKSESEIVDLLTGEDVPVSEIAKFIETLSSSEDFAKNMSANAISKFSQALAQSFDKNKKKFEKSYRDSMTKDFCEF